eukprot:4926377-Pleurochrysis_carterae.AAC.1
MQKRCEGTCQWLHRESSTKATVHVQRAVLLGLHLELIRSTSLSKSSAQPPKEAASDKSSSNTVRGQHSLQHGLAVAMHRKPLLSPTECRSDEMPLQM